jgi:hypothetical protein
LPARSNPREKLTPSGRKNKKIKKKNKKKIHFIRLIQKQKSMKISR